MSAAFEKYLATTLAPNSSADIASISSDVKPKNAEALLGRVRCCNHEGLLLRFETNISTGWRYRNIHFALGQTALTICIANVFQLFKLTFIVKWVIVYITFWLVEEIVLRLVISWFFGPRSVSSEPAEPMGEIHGNTTTV